MNTVFIAGASVMDVIGHADHHPQRGETVIGTELSVYPGGKGYNQAIAAARLGVPTRFIGAVGSDGFGRDLRAYLEGEGVDTTALYTLDGTSGAALINIDRDGRVAANVVYGANDRADVGILSGVVPRVNDVLITQLEIPFDTIEAFLLLARRSGARSMVNLAPARGIPSAIRELPDVLVLNEVDLNVFSGYPIVADSSVSEVARAAEQLQHRPDQWVIVTSGSKGLIATGPDGQVVIAGRDVPVRNTLGAADCFVGALGARLASGDAMPDALQYANVAASLSVQRDGAGPSMPFADEVGAALRAEVDPILG